MQDPFGAWASMIIRGRTWVLFGTALVTIGSIVTMSRLQVVIDPVSMLPSSHPYVMMRPVLEETFGEAYALIVSLTPADGDIHSPAFIEIVDNLTQAFGDFENVIQSTLLSPTHPNAKVTLSEGDSMEVRRVEVALADRALFDRWIELNPILQGTLISDDRSSVSLLARFNADGQGYDAILAQVEPVLEPARKGGVMTRLSGHVRFLAEIERYSMRMLWLVPLAIVLIGLVHFEAFRSWQGMILPLVTSSLALTWVLGLFGAAGVTLDVFNSTTPILVLAVAAGHSVQILKRFVEEYELLREGTSISPEKANVEAVIRSLRNVGPSMTAAGLIASTGFFSLMVFEMGSVKAFGLFSGMGILSALVIEMTFIPALRSLLTPPTYPSPIVRSVWTKFVDVLSRAVGSPLLMPIVLALIAAMAFGAVQVRIDNSNRSNFADWTQIRRQDEFINAHFAGTQLLYAVVDSGVIDGALDSEFLRGVDLIQRAVSREEGVGKSLSIVDYLKRMNQAAHGDAHSAYVMPESSDLAAQLLLLYEISGGTEDLSSFIDHDRRRVLIKVMIKRDETLFVESLIDRVGAIASSVLPAGATVGFGGGAADAAAINEVLARDKLLNIAQIMAVVFVASGCFFWSVSAAILVVLPLLITVIAVFGILGWSGIPLNIPTSLVSAMAVGIGADYAIYLLARFREESRKSTDMTVVLQSTMRGAGKACLYVATAVSVGYGVLVCSFGFRVHQWMGMLIASAMLVSALSTLLIVSWCVVRWRPRFLFGPKWGGQLLG